MKALQREDLLRILDAIFNISRVENNAFKMLEDGLYVEDYSVHEAKEDMHINSFLKEILNKLSLDDNGNLLYNNLPVNISISSESENAIIIKPDGLYVKKIDDLVKTHMEDEIIHVTEKDRENWDGMFEEAKKYVIEELKKLIILNIQEVAELPSPQNASSSTLYILKENESIDETIYTWYVNIHDKFIPLNITKRTLDLYLTKKEIEDNYYLKKDAHDHEHLDVLEKLHEDENGNLMYNDTGLCMAYVSDLPNNAIADKDGKLFVQDFSKEIKSLQLASSFNKVNLFSGECNKAGTYALQESIDNFNLILVDYYYKPNDATQTPGFAKSVIIDTDTLNELYKKGIDYCLELGYGISNSNCKFNMSNKTLRVNYYHNICIYKITGIGRGDE